MRCGASSILAVMLKALVSFYKVSKSLIGLTIVLATIGVRQGSKTPCLILYL